MQQQYLLLKSDRLFFQLLPAQLGASVSVMGPLSPTASQGVTATTWSSQSPGDRRTLP